MGLTFSQMFPPGPTFTERDLPDLHGKVFIVTGGASGVGAALTAMLYYAGGKVYIAGRSEAAARERISEIQGQPSEFSTGSAGQLEFLHLELDDLASIKASAEAFRAKESRLDVLFNNAGVSQAPIGSVTKQNVELHLGTNALGHYLFTQLLLPTLLATAATSPPGSVRVVWTSSIVVDGLTPPGGIVMAELSAPTTDRRRNYTISKTGNWYLASELARDVGRHGIISVTQNPGNLKTNALRHMPAWQRFVVQPMLYEAKFGAYTNLMAGFSPEVTMEVNGGYILPWGRMHTAPRDDLLEALKSVEEGGTGQAGEFREWCEKQTAEYR